MTTHGIPILQTFSELYEFTRFDRTPCSESFDIFTHRETYPEVRRVVPPHRRNFFTVILLESQQEGEMFMNEQKHSHLDNILFFQGPEHIFSFTRGRAMNGFVALFNQEFLFRFVDDPIAAYSFFSSLQNNLFQLDDTSMNRFRQMFSLLYEEREDPATARHLLMSIMEKANSLQGKYEQIENAIPAELKLVTQFKRLIDANFIEKRSVEFYASRLNLTANYLNDRIKAHTGKTAKAHIIDRVLLEAKNLLIYSDMDVAAISHSLEFVEPTYFGKFFKQHTGLTPKNYRSQNDPGLQ